MRLAVIPARGGSKRIPKKNITPFFGRPLIAYALDAVANSGMFDKIHVSTDAEEICEVVEALGHSVDFKRDESLADDFTGLVWRSRSPSQRLTVLSWEQTVCAN